MSSLPAYNIPQLVLEGDQLAVINSYKYKETLKEIGCRWEPTWKAWVLPCTPENYRKLTRVIPGLQVDKALIAHITELTFKNAQAETILNTSWQTTEPIAPMPVRATPYQHQIHAFNLGATLDAAAYFMEMGTGKTLPATATAGYRYAQGQVKRLLVICPASVMSVWMQEIDKFADFPARVEVLDGPIKKRCQQLADWQDTDALQVVILNYEGARGMVDAILRWHPDMLILDEAHRCKTPGSQQSKAMAKLGSKIRYKLALTGTPITNSPLDVYGIYRALDPSIFGTSFYAFRNRYALMGGWENRQVVGYKNMEELAYKIHKIGFRLRKDECLDLPDMTDVYRICQLETEAQALYEQMRKESITELEAGKTVIAANVLAKLLRLSQIAGGYLDNVQVSKAKLRLLEDVLEDLGGQKVVIFCRFLDEKRGVEKLLAQKRIAYVSLEGSTPMHDRGALVERFQTDADCQVFVGQIATAGIGITLHAANTAIFYSCSFSYAELDQARSRLHRSGQKHPVTNIFLMAKNTVDEKILSALAEKRDIASNVIDNWRDFLK